MFWQVIPKFHYSLREKVGSYRESRMLLEDPVCLNDLSTEYLGSFGRRCQGERFLYGLGVCKLRSDHLLIFFVRAVASPIFELFHHMAGASTMEPSLSLSSGLSPRFLCLFGSKETMLGCRNPSIVLISGTSSFEDCQMVLNLTV